MDPEPTSRAVCNPKNNHVRNPEITMPVYAREKAPFEAEFPLVRENLIEDKSTGTFVM